MAPNQLLRSTQTSVTFPSTGRLVVYSKPISTITKRWKENSLSEAFVKLIGDPSHNTGSVSRFVVASTRPSVLHAIKHGVRLLNYLKNEQHY